MNLRRAHLPAVALLLLAACDDRGAASSTAPTVAASASSASSVATTASAASSATAGKSIDRATFNKIAVRLNLPVYWVSDANKNGAPDPSEIEALLFYPTSPKWVEAGAFTKSFEDARAQIVAAASAPAPTDRRLALVQQELDGAVPTLVRTDLRSLSQSDKDFVTKMIAVGAAVDELYAVQTGSKALAAKIPAGDLLSQSLFRRDIGPSCQTTKFETNTACSAVAGGGPLVVDVYPAAMQSDPKFCATLEKNKDAKTLLTPFSVVREKAGQLVAVPFNEAYGPQMNAVAAKLDDAAASVVDPNEKALAAYLRAAAASFRSNDWNGADEAWAAMTVDNSKWYVRVAPDETYWEPCSQKAGFHMAFARINQGSKQWQVKLKPVQQEMEDDLGARIGAPYKARTVTFHLPDFIDIATNQGEDRQELGATIGQSLPNWGPLVDAGRGRTVAMSNLYTDPDSLATYRQKSSTLLDAASMKSYPIGDSPSLFATILHEATHNLGPSHDYRVNGRTDADAFGGDLASMMEELKAQTGALYFIDFALKKGLITPEMAKQTYVDSITWAFGHISRGMYTETGKRKPYGVLAAIQIGILMDEGALTFGDGLADNGQDKGAFTIHFDKMPAAAEKMMKVVGGLKASADRAGAEALAKKYADGPTVPHKIIAERLLRFPQTSLVYAVDL